MAVDPGDLPCDVSVEPVFDNVVMVIVTASPGMGDRFGIWFPEQAGFDPTRTISDPCPQAGSF